jgi:hypothetical protein
MYDQQPDTQGNGPINPMDQWAMSSERGGSVDPAQHKAYIDAVVQAVQAGEISPAGVDNLSKRVRGLEPFIRSAQLSRQSNLKGMQEIGKYFSPAQAETPDRPYTEQDVGSGVGPYAIGSPIMGTGQPAQPARADYQSAINRAMQMGNYQLADQLAKQSKEVNGSLNDQFSHADALMKMRSTDVKTGVPYYDRIPKDTAQKYVESGRVAIGDNAALDQETLTFMAKQAMSGDTSVFQGLGNGVQGSRNRVALRKEISKLAGRKSMTPEDLAASNAEYFGLKAGQRTLGTRTANIEMAVNEASQMADLALNASNSLDRTGVKSINDVMQAVQKGTRSPELRNFVAANTSLINAYARAVNPNGTPTDHDKTHAREMLSTGFDKGDYASAVGQLKKEMAAAQNSPGIVRKGFREAITNRNQPETSVAPANPGSSVAPTALTPAQQRLHDLLSGKK